MRTISKTRMKTKRTTIGSRPLVLLVVCGLTILPCISGKDKKKRAEAAEPTAVIAGTVFRAEGFALSGAEITVNALQTADSGSNSNHLKNLKTTANGRGEFAVRVPAVPAKYRIDVKLRGFESQTKDVSIEGEQRKELNFLLEAAK